MARNNRAAQYRPRTRGGARASSGPPPLASASIERNRAPTVYGKPFIIMEDESKKTFVYQSGSWVPHDMSIAECRQASYQIKELPQKVNRMTRYEVASPV